MSFDVLSMGVRFAKKLTSFQFFVQFCKNCGFQFAFGFTELSEVLVFSVWFFALCCLMCMHSIGPTNCQLKLLRTIETA